MSFTETQAVLHEAREAFKRGQWAALAMIAAVEGSAYRRPGAKMLLSGGNRMWGNLSGGCLEADLYLVAEEAAGGGQSLLRTYDLTEDAMWSLGIGCKGTVHVLVWPMAAEDPFWTALDRMLGADEPTVLIFELPEGRKGAWRVDGTRLGDDFPPELESVIPTQLAHTRARIVTVGDRRFVLDGLVPAPKLILAGAGHDAEPVARLAADAGFSVTLLDPRPQFNQAERFPGATHLVAEPTTLDPSRLPADAYWLIMNHHHARDTASLRLALESRPRWIGVLGPVSRTEEMLRTIGRRPEAGRFAAPVGLDLGAESPAEVAISIVSQLMAERNGRPALPLHGQHPIHR